MTTQCESASVAVVGVDKAGYAAWVKPLWAVSILSPIPLALVLMLTGDFAERPQWLNLSSCILILSLGLAAITDFRWRKIPNAVTYPTALWALVINGLASALEASEHSLTLPTGAVGLSACIAGFAVCFLVMFFIFRVSGGGAGDVKLAAVIGAFLGVEQGLTALVAAYVVAAAVILTWHVWASGPFTLAKAVGRKVGTTMLPVWIAPPSVSEQTLLRRPIALAPFFAIGTIASAVLPQIW